MDCHAPSPSLRGPQARGNPSLRAVGADAHIGPPFLTKKITAHKRLRAGHPISKGGLRMESERLWQLFLATGLPEAYSLLSLLREEEEAAEQDKTA